MSITQPPSGGCVLKQRQYVKNVERNGQPPSGGCVLKQRQYVKNVERNGQPPSGGCVLKHPKGNRKFPLVLRQPPSGGCVLKHAYPRYNGGEMIAAAFGRLCVETFTVRINLRAPACSRLRAAVC